MIEHVVINDVGPRDGLQNQPKILSVAERLQLIHALCDANVQHIEVGAFVSPKAVPAMAASDEVFKGLIESKTQGWFSALIPNMRGYQLAAQANAETVAMVLYASESMAQKNVGMSRQQAADTTKEILKQAADDGIKVIATIAVAFECPFDGPIDPAIVIATAEEFLAQGASQIVIADTIGAANPAQVSAMMNSLVKNAGSEHLCCHFHDTRALGMANVYAAVQSGIRCFDASIAGLGGCPFAPGATGNIATEDAVMMLHSMGFETGIDLPKLIEASDLAEQITGTAPGGRSKKWLKPFLQKQQTNN